MNDPYIPVHFSRKEFQTCTPSCEIEDMDPWFLRLLDKLRDYCEFPLMLNSAYRSVEYEKKHGRSGNSMHCKGRAVDIHCVDVYKRHQIIKYAIILGFPGIGVYPTFIHLDNRPIGTIWIGETTKK